MAGTLVAQAWFLIDPGRPRSRDKFANVASKKDKVKAGISIADGPIIFFLGEDLRMRRLLCMQTMHALRCFPKETRAYIIDTPRRPIGTRHPTADALKPNLESREARMGLVEYNTACTEHAGNQIVVGLLRFNPSDGKWTPSPFPASWNCGAVLLQRMQSSRLVSGLEKPCSKTLTKPEVTDKLR
ncbi:hypothetical protein B0T26DRAFT_676874 [Lasiosphaeria miniovina]|uniref:Uncharacterized protein n=1 Tax=Lasiosphaeria miniovina TaxID=1954250 RepID=A0AA40AAP3_9PEZI|nr:uncharacterized protein B0T26DRAFT_676874 [Lasiosphaeria miniovina]KAK0712410.1 hypothetical protein B0T26DRAFT_676874 [Lasiosphaeria miniovina]